MLAYLAMAVESWTVAMRPYSSALKDVIVAPCTGPAPTMYVSSESAIRNPYEPFVACGAEPSLAVESVPCIALLMSSGRS